MGFFMSEASDVYLATSTIYKKPTVIIARQRRNIFFAK